MADYITKEGMLRLRVRMNELIKERSVIMKQVVTAREMGDLSENAEYHAAREKQRYLENEFNHIKSRIGKLQVIDPKIFPKMLCVSEPWLPSGNYLMKKSENSNLLESMKFMKVKMSMNAFLLHLRLARQ